MKPESIAVVGGGPAGATAAAQLAAAGRQVVLIDEKLAWEKPCGGGLTHKALKRYPFLAEAKAERNWVRGCELISPGGRRAWFELDQQIAIFSRRVLNGLILERARAAGAEIVCERVVEIAGQPGAWQLRTRHNELTATYIVLAAGARNPFRFSAPLAPADLMATAGYYIPGTGDSIHISFLRGVEGYIWLFPRRDHLSAGICGKIDATPTRQLRRILEQFLAQRGLDPQQGEFFSHVLPAPRVSTLQRRSLQGEGWALVGDAAGLVDPITGEGLYYALRSAELLAQALIAGTPEIYEQNARQELLPELETAAYFAHAFYSGHFLGGRVLDRMVQFTAASRRVRQLMCDVFSGAQGYVGLRRRAYHTFVCALPELLLGPEGIKAEAAE
ncbi:MAG TPA: geranylgeranyl reductase family protein [Terriglobales bacterium]|nr:geranylgeranyl reductase family protein [Terriglobales bacterium]